MRTRNDVLRREIQRWAKRAGFTAQQSIDDPESILDFFDFCIEHYPQRFSRAHGREIFRWCNEGAPGYQPIEEPTECPPPGS
jgi:hypothetical protein